MVAQKPNQHKLMDVPPVLIVGAGPTGMAAAMSLSRSGIPVRIIDKAAQPSPWSRAIGIQARTLELFEQHRLVEPFLALGHKAHVANLYSNGHRLARLDFDPLQTRYPYLLFLEQATTERLMAEHLAAFGVTIERGVELLNCDQGSASLQATLRYPNGAEEKVRPSYIIGADGAHSTVRHGLNIGFTGKTFEQTFLLADLHADTEWPDDEFHIFASGEGIAALFPMRDGRVRLIADRRAPAEGTKSDAPTLDECCELIAQRIQHRVSASSLEWSSYFHLNSRMAETLRSGRIFLAGDAAHVHSPAGAQGMNTGIQEAFNLGWKITRVLTASAPDRLLDTYYAERHPIERDVLRQSSLMTQLAAAGHGPIALIRDHVTPALSAIGPLRDAARRAVSELSVQYRKSPLTLDRSLDGGPRAGDRAPDAWVHVIDGPLGRVPGAGCLFDLHDPACFSLFLLVAPTGEEDVALAPATLTVANTIRDKDLDDLSSNLSPACFPTRSASGASPIIPAIPRVRSPMPTGGRGRVSIS